jgi:hypothetical protein
VQPVQKNPAGGCFASVACKPAPSAKLILEVSGVLSFIFLPTENAYDVGNSGKPITSKAQHAQGNTTLRIPVFLLTPNRYLQDNIAAIIQPLA